MFTKFVNSAENAGFRIWRWLMCQLFPRLAETELMRFCLQYFPLKNIFNIGSGCHSKVLHTLRVTVIYRVRYFHWLFKIWTEFILIDLIYNQEFVRCTHSQNLLDDFILFLCYYFVLMLLFSLVVVHSNFKIDLNVFI